MGGPSGEALVLLAAVVSFQLAAGKSAEQIELISAFFEILGDNLALLAARRIHQDVEHSRIDIPGKIE